MSTPAIDPRVIKQLKIPKPPGAPGRSGDGRQGYNLEAESKLPAERFKLLRVSTLVLVMIVLTVMVADSGTICLSIL